MDYKHHVFVCMNRRPEGHPKGSCQLRGSGQLIEALSAELATRGLFDSVLVTGSFCLGPCDLGPTVVIYPDGVWYGRVKPEDVHEIVENHLQKGQPVERLRIR